jgi:general secretion pathway protein G
MNTNTNQRRRTTERGVTLIEMMVVVIIIGLFAALVGPQLFKNVGKSKRTAAHAQIESFLTALVSYNGDVGSFPSTDLGLQALRVRPESVTNWNGPYLMKDIPLDPWNHAYLYKYPGEHGDAPEIVSLGADGLPGGEGDNADIVCWSNK